VDGVIVTCRTVLGVGLLGLFGIAVGAAEPRKTPVTLPRTEQLDLTSRGGLTYRIFISEPVGDAPAGGYPVVYFPDGNAHFPTLVAAARALLWPRCPVVLVGIGYPGDAPIDSDRRFYDLTPLTPKAVLEKLPLRPLPPKTGGEDEFLGFIQDEVKPLVEKRFPIDRTRQALYGHSFGGRFALHVLFTRPDAFQAYHASSPSVWYNDRSILAEEAAFAGRVREKKDVTARLLVTVGQWEQTPGPGVEGPRAAMLKDRRMVDNARELADRLAKLPGGLRVEFRHFDEEDHGSVVLPAMSKGVRLLLAPKP
jgi:predicted alpha/beta superfamily hydrolase